MSVALLPEGRVRLDGICPVGDAEPLLRLLTSNREAIVDWRRCEGAHAAVIQILLAVKPEMLGPPAGTFLQSRIAPIVIGARASQG